MSNPFAQYLQQFDEPDWHETLARLQDEIHPVDRNATRIWFGFWPMKLRLGLQQASDPLQQAKEWLLYGEYELDKALDSSVNFLYGSRWWSSVKKQVVDYADDPDPGADSLSDHIRAVTKAVARREQVAPDVLTGICAVGLMAFRQIGPARLRELAGSEATTSPPRKSAEEIVERRQKKRRKGLMGWLRTIDQRHRVTWSEQGGRYFEAIQGQDITMAAARDTENYEEMDPRRVEGPIPIQCRNGACGFCWVGLLQGRENVSEITGFEKDRLSIFGYSHADDMKESHPLIRLGCQCKVYGDVTIVVPPWNGVLNGRR